jgi:hypothetical protein
MTWPTCSGRKAPEPEPRRHPGHPEQVALRAVGALADRLGHLVGLAEARADVAVLVPDDDERREREPPAALDDLGHAVDVDDAVDQLANFFGIDQHSNLPSRS